MGKPPLMKVLFLFWHERFTAPCSFRRPAVQQFLASEGVASETDLLQRIRGSRASSLAASRAPSVAPCTAPGDADEDISISTDIGTGIGADLGRVEGLLESAKRSGALKSVQLKKLDEWLCGIHASVHADENAEVADSDFEVGSSRAEGQ